MIPTPWIKAYDPAQEFLSGHAQGVQIAEANARLQQSQQHAAMQAELEKQRIEQQSRMESQRIEISKAYHDSQVALERDRLAQAKEMNDFQMKKYADMAAARMEISKRIASGEDPTKVIMEVGARAGDVGSAMSATVRAYENKLAKVPEQWIPADPVTGAPGHFRESRGGIKFPPSQKAAEDKITTWERDRLKGPEKSIQDIENQIIEGKWEGRQLAAARKRQVPYKQEVNQIYKVAGEKIPYPEVEGVGLAFRYDEKGNPIRIAGEEEKPSFMSDVWEAIKSAPGKALGLGKGRTTEAPTVIPNAPVMAPTSVPSWPPSADQLQPSTEAFPTPVIAPQGSIAPPPEAAQPAPAPFALGQAPIPPSVQATGVPQPAAQQMAASSPPVVDEERVLDAWRNGEISKTDAMRAIGRHIIGPEWTSAKTEDKWHWEMKKDASGKMTHYYPD